MLSVCCVVDVMNLIICDDFAQVKSLNPCAYSLGPGLVVARVAHCCRRHSLRLFITVSCSTKICHGFVQTLAKIFFVSGVEFAL